VKDGLDRHTHCLPCHGMTTSEATRLARQVVADLGSDDATKRLAAVMLLLADEVDRLAGVVDRFSRHVR